MKKFLLLPLLVPFLLLSACNNDSSTNGNDKTNQQEEKNNKTKEESSKHEAEDEYSYGDFEVVKAAKDIGSYKSGPISLRIEEAHLVSGTFADEYYIDHFGEKDAEYIQIAMVISTENKDINFNSKHLTLTTETGEKIDSPSDFMGTKVETQYLSKNDLTRILFYFFEESEVKDIDTVNLHVKAPTDNNGETLGEDIDIEMHFKEEGKQ